MKFYQINKIVRHERINVTHFIKEVRDQHDRLLQYEYMGEFPILKSSPYYDEYIDYKNSGPIKRQIIGPVLKRD